MNWRNAGALFVVLIVPILLILLFKTGTTKIGKLPVYGPKQYVNGDSFDYRVPLHELCSIGTELKGKHVLLYFSESRSDLLAPEAAGNLELVERRFHEVDDVVILSISNESFATTRNDRWLQCTTNADLLAYVSEHLMFDFTESEQPIDDHMAFLLDKDHRLRGYFFAPHDKLDRDLLGELVVLRTEYGFKGQSETVQ